MMRIMSNARVTECEVNECAAQLAHADFLIEELIADKERLLEENARLKRGESPSRGDSSHSLNQMRLIG